MLHAMSEIGEAWTLPFRQTGANNTTDNPVFHFKNTSDKPFDVHAVICSSAEAGTWSVYYGRTYTSGGSALTLAQLNTLSGKTQDMNAYYGTALTLAGTAVLAASTRAAANTPVDVFQKQQAFQVEPSGTFEIRFEADAGNNKMEVIVFTHGEEPWE